MAGRRSALGRGLGALIPGPQERNESAPERTPPEARPRPGDDSGQAILQLPVGSISPNPDQPRRHFDSGELARLAKSLSDHGVLQPVVVRRANAANGESEGRAYELLVGERRWRAAQQAGLETLPALVADVAAPDRLELALVENVQRSDLNPIELALAFQGLAESGWTQEKIGQRVGFDRSSVSNHLRLLDLSPEMQQDLEAGRLQMGHAKALLAIPDPSSRRRLRDQVVRDQLSVRQSEAAARRLRQGRPERTRRSDPRSGLDLDEQALVRALRNHLKTQVRIRGSATGGRIEIDYSGASELERLIALVLPS